MSQTLDLESDPFLTVLTDALRAGPGSPQWQQAVARLKTDGSPDVDEYKLLVAAREHLESGKDYRSVRAGPGFTRKLMTGLEEDDTDGRKPAIPSANLIAMLSALGILIVLGLVAYQLWPRGQVAHVSPDELVNAPLTGDIIPSTTFDKGIPPRWRKIGRLPLETKGALFVPPGGGDPGGAGLVALDPIRAEDSFSYDVTLRTPKGAGNLVPQVFISAGPDVGEDRLTGEHELVWSLEGDQQSVLVNGQTSTPDASTRPAESQGESVRVTVVMNRDTAVVSAGDKRLWAGPHQLGDAPRYVGVRFIRTANPAGASDTPPAVLSVRVQKKRAAG